MLSKKQKNCKNMSFSRSTKNQNLIFEWKQFFKNWHVEKRLIQNVTRCIFSIQNLTRSKNFYFEPSFHVVVELLPENNLMDNDNGLRLKYLSRVCVMCLSQFWYYSLLFAFFIALAFLMVVVSISFALPIDLYKSLRISKNGHFTKVLF